MGTDPFRLAEEAAEQTLRTIISWGRYAEAFAYDAVEWDQIVASPLPEQRRRFEELMSLTPPARA